MTFILGLLCGAGVVCAMRGGRWTVRVHKVGKSRHRCRSTDGWERTRNFLYYDGTVMPTNKEEQNE